MCAVNIAHLDAMRAVGDPLVDPIVETYLAKQPGRLGPLLGQLFSTPRLPEKEPLVAAYLSALPADPWEDPEVLAAGQSVFDVFGPEVLLVLGSCALPLAYAAGNGVQVVARARRLKDDPIRRLCDTAQMVINVMQPGELRPGRVGWASARKVRLMHALIRQQVQLAPEKPWDSTWGNPINQEDQAGTLLTFSVGVLYGLRRIGVAISPPQADAYIRLWSMIGGMLGVDATLLPRTEAAARELAFSIGQRQVRATPEGRLLFGFLLQAVDSLFPVSGYASSLSRYLLDDTAFGANVAMVLGAPPPNWTRWLVRARAAEKRATLKLLEAMPGAKRRRSFVARHVVQRLLLMRRPDSNVPFEVPERLRAKWDMRR